MNYSKILEQDICEHLCHEFEKFLSKIEDEKLRHLIREKAYFAGGCIYSLRNGREVKDYDLFLKDTEIIEDLKKLDCWSYISEYALSIGKYQVVVKYFGEPDLCVGQFDFKHNMHYYIPGESKIRCAYMEELDEEPEIDDFKYLETNELVFNENRARDIEGVFLRIKKFTDRGMIISKQTKKKIKQRTTKRAVKKYARTRKRGNRRSYY